MRAQIGKETSFLEVPESLPTLRFTNIQQKSDFDISRVQLKSNYFSGPQPISPRFSNGFHASLPIVVGEDHKDHD
jgi:hypothetical protein